MNELLKQAKEILMTKETVRDAIDFMTKEQREALANDFASRKQFLSASYFAPNAKKRKEYERLFWENIIPKNN